MLKAAGNPSAPAERSMQEEVRYDDKACQSTQKQNSGTDHAQQTLVSDASSACRILRYF